LVTVLASFKIPTDSALPFWLVFELNNIAGLSGTDRLMGVLPTRWFDRFSYELWKDVPGLSLVESAPHAVIFVARHGESSPGPAMTLSAHELGHTYGLSVDARLKKIGSVTSIGLGWVTFLVELWVALTSIRTKTRNFRTEIPHGGIGFAAGTSPLLSFP
jgi:hypothetical protein